jgi:hypothetical protein
VNSTKKRIALATGRRIIAINLPVVGEAKAAASLTTRKWKGVFHPPST